MATTLQGVPSTEAAILDRLIHPGQADLPCEAAKALLTLRFDQQDLDRIHELVTRNQADALTPAERSELESYLRVGSFIELLQAKARLSLKKHA
jgi:hypothetical protein